MPRSRSCALTAAAIAAAALVAGCGGDNAAERSGARASGPAAAATPGSQFLVDAEAICKVANEKEVAAGATGIGWLSSGLFTDLDFLQEFRNIGRSALTQLRELTPPPQDERQVADALDGIDRMLKGLDKQIAGVREGKTGNGATATYENGYTDLVAAGGPLGFTECLGIVL